LLILQGSIFRNFFRIYRYYLWSTNSYNFTSIYTTF